MTFVAKRVVSGDAWPSAQVGVCEGVARALLPVFATCPTGPDGTWREGNKESSSPRFEGPGFGTWKPSVLIHQNTCSKAAHRFSHLPA